MMQKLLVAGLVALIAMPGYAEVMPIPSGGAGGVDNQVEQVEEEESPFSANVSLVSNYLYRGLSQTGGKPAIQGGFDYEHSSGFYVGVWGSNTSFFSDLYKETAGALGASSSSLELDTYLGFKNSLPNDVFYDVGFLRYNYPGTYAPPAIKADTNEVYGSIGYKWVSVKYSYSLGDTFGNPNTRGTNYAEINANYPFEQAGVTLGAHYGKQSYRGAGAIDANGNSLSYSDYKLSVTKELGDFELALAYSGTNATPAYTVLGKKLGKGAAIVSLSRSF